ncbi:MAG TPA: molybdopterin molybdenumtransferase MoeA, partial [Stellaceae bacterium]|nr:molybdopterin molybdenumtransferase MoeA [Stellaceae bacterium]
MAQLSDDCFAFGGDLMSISAALKLIEQQVTPQVESETVPVKEARRRILAAPLKAPRDVPPHDN